MSETGVIETFGSPILQDVEFNQDGSLKASGKQRIKFYNKKRLSFRALRDEKGDLVIDTKTGIPAKEAFEEVVEMVRIETKGDTNIIDDIADDLKKRQFYRQYKYFREGKVPDGNPIEDFDFIQPNTVMELHMIAIHTIQQCAVMSDLECEAIKDQSGFEVRDVAAQWVKINSPQGQAGKAHRLESEVAKLRREIEELKASKGAGARLQEMIEDPRSFSADIASKGPPVEEIATLEISADQLTRRPRKV